MMAFVDDVEARIAELTAERDGLKKEISELKDGKDSLIEGAVSIGAGRFNDMRLAEARAVKLREAITELTMALQAYLNCPTFDAADRLSIAQEQSQAALADSEGWV